ncbi:MAG: diguanylate cyclase [Synergistales bacterium]|nr:diguanylate cyclase [Synergistales bacterium]
MHRFHSSKHLIAVVVLLFVGFAVTSIVSYGMALHTLRKEIIEQELPLTTDNIYSEIHTYLLRTVYISSTMAHDTFLRDWVLAGEKNTGKIVRYLREIKEQHDTVTSFFISDITRTYYQAEGVLKTVRPDSWRDEWFYRLKAAHEPYEVNVDYDMANEDALTIFINHKVKDYDGDFIGAAGVGLAVGRLRELIDSYEERFGRRIYCADSEGNLTIHGDSIRTRSDTFLGHPGLDGRARDVLSRSAGGERQSITFTYNRDGEVMHLEGRYLPEFQWFLFVEQNEAKAARQIRRALLLNIVIGVLISLVVTLLIFVVIASYERHLVHAATVDPLTGVNNRYAFDQNLRRLGGVDASSAMLLADLDHFKSVNDTYGHLTGDAVLQHVAALIEGQIGPGDAFARWGGEEFIILAGNRTAGEVLELGERIRGTVAQTPYTDGESTIGVTVSIGAAMGTGSDDGDTLLQRVDDALYKAKDKGRNCLAFSREER